MSMEFSAARGLLHSDEDGFGLIPMDSFYYAVLRNTQPCRGGLRWRRTLQGHQPDESAPQTKMGTRQSESP